jgi:Mor family transcriptional regulator
MIRDLVKLVEYELGTDLPSDACHRLEAALCRTYGGERMYVPKLPKLVHQVRIAAIGSSMGTGTSGPSAALAGNMGLSVRQVRRIVRGR